MEKHVLVPFSLEEHLVIRKSMKKERKCTTKLIFILLNIFYLIIAVFAFTAGVTGKFVYFSYGLMAEFDLISTFLIVSNVALSIVSIFGIFTAWKDSVVLNIYAFLMIITSLVQTSAAFVGYTLIDQSQSIARHTLARFMYSYDFNELSSTTIDWIQKSFQCCGIDNPTDWLGNLEFSHYNEFYNEQVFTVQPRNQTPQSCCSSGRSGYLGVECDNYFQNGCLVEVDEMISETVVIIYFVALALAVFEIISSMGAFVVALICRSKPLKSK